MTLRSMVQIRTTLVSSLVNEKKQFGKVRIHSSELSQVGVNKKRYFRK